jgi:serine/threonine protein kinase
MTKNKNNTIRKTNKNTNNTIRKTNKNTNSKSKQIVEKGGNVLASGGFGCVFSPALICQGEKKRPSNKISKLMTEKHAMSEYQEIVSIKDLLQDIRDYRDYFLIYDATLCKPASLSAEDLENYTSKCRALPKNKITKLNINENLDNLMSLNMPNGGLPVDDYLYKNGSLTKMYNVHSKLLLLLQKGILPMNKRNIYHGDIKDSNVLVDANNKTRLIDWGLAVEYIPFKQHTFPRTWKNRPFQFNVPFSVILFSDSFVEKYTTFLQGRGQPNKIELKPFVIDYISAWMKERGAGHYKFINEIMYELFSHSMSELSKESKAQIVETQITMNFIINYIVDVLVHFTKPGLNVKDGISVKDGINVKDCLRNYLDNVFIKIVDIWGFISVYFVYIEILSNNYSKLTKQEMEIFNKIKYIFIEYLYNPRHEPINMNSLHSDLDDVTSLFRKRSNHARGTNKTRKISISKTNVSFKRRPKKRRFKKPFLLSLK